MIVFNIILFDNFISNIIRILYRVRSDTILLYIDNNIIILYDPRIIYYNIRIVCSRRIDLMNLGGI